MKTNWIKPGLALLALFLPLTGFALLEQLLQIPPPAPDFKLDFGGECLKYEVKWSGFRAAEAWVCTTGAGDQYRVKGYARTLGLPRTLWRMDDWGEVDITRDFRLVNYCLHDREVFSNLDISMTMNPETKVATIKRVNLDKNKTKYKTVELYQGFEPVGLASLARSLEWKTGQKRYFEFTDGAERYVILISAGPVEQVTVAAGTFNTIRLDPYLFRIPRTKAKEMPELLQNIQQLNTWKQIAEYAKIWMAVDGNRPFVLVKGKAFIGEVSLELVQMNARMPPLPSPGK